MTDWLLTHLAMLAPTLLQLSIKLTLLFASLWLLSMALRTFSPALRHRVWSASIVGVFLAPLICHLLPWELEVQENYSPLASGACWTVSRHRFLLLPPISTHWEGI